MALLAFLPALAAHAPLVPAQGADRVRRSPVSVLVIGFSDERKDAACKALHPDSLAAAGFQPLTCSRWPGVLLKTGDDDAIAEWADRNLILKPPSDWEAGVTGNLGNLGCALAHFSA